MISTISEEAAGLGISLKATLSRAGGLELTRRHIIDPSAREADTARQSDELGLWEIDPAESQIELEAAAEACRAAGTEGWAYPLAERLAGGPGEGAIGLVVGEHTRLMAHADLDLRWHAVDLAGNRYVVEQVGSSTVGSRLAPFVGDVTISKSESAPDPGLAARLLTLQSAWLLGLLQRALSDTMIYVTERHQFGRPLSKFQGLRFDLASMSVAAQKVEELLKYTLWSLAHHDGDEQLTDALALRLATLESADIVLSGAHQLHGAMGFCDETDVSILSRVSHAVRRLPAGREELSSLLVERMMAGGFRGPFAVGAVAGTTRDNG